MRASMVVSPDETSCDASRRLGAPGRGGRIRTGDLEYPKLPRYQAALRPARRGGRPIRPGVDYTLRGTPASKAGSSSALAEPGMGDPVAGRNPELARGPGNDFEHTTRRRAGGNDVVGFRLRTFGYPQYASIAADENHVERNVGVVHPHLDDLIGLELEQHALAFRERAAEHQPAGPLFVGHR